MPRRLQLKRAVGPKKRAPQKRKPLLPPEIVAEIELGYEAHVQIARSGARRMIARAQVARCRALDVINTYSMRAARHSINAAREVRMTLVAQDEMLNPRGMKVDLDVGLTSEAAKVLETIETMRADGRLPSKVDLGGQD